MLVSIRDPQKISCYTKSIIRPEKKHKFICHFIIKGIKQTSAPKYYFKFSKRLLLLVEMIKVINSNEIKERKLT